MYICFFLASSEFKSQSVLDGREFLKPESMIAIMVGTFHFGTFFCVFLRAIPGI